MLNKTVIKHAFQSPLTVIRKTTLITEHDSASANFVYLWSSARNLRICMHNSHISGADRSTPAPFTNDALTSRFLSVPGIRMLGFICRRYSRLFLVIAGLLVCILNENFQMRRYLDSFATAQNSGGRGQVCLFVICSFLGLLITFVLRCVVGRRGCEFWWCVGMQRRRQVSERRAKNTASSLIREVTGKNQRDTDSNKQVHCSHLCTVSQKTVKIVFVMTRVVKRSSDLRTSNFKFEFVFVFQPFDIRIQAIRHRRFCLESGVPLLHVTSAVWRFLCSLLAFNSSDARRVFAYPSLPLPFLHTAAAFNYSPSCIAPHASYQSGPDTEQTSMDSNRVWHGLTSWLIALLVDCFPACGVCAVTFISPHSADIKRKLLKLLHKCINKVRIKSEF